MQTCITSVNASGIALLRDIALNPAGVAERALLPYVPSDLWRKLNNQGIARLAQLPVLLFDMNFRDERWWDETIASRKAHAPASTFVVREALAELAREILMVAWLSARGDGRIAALVTGMSRRTAALVADLTPADVTRVASIGAAEVQLRWRRSESFWSTLLSAAADQNPQLLHLATLHSLQLSCDVGTTNYLDAGRTGKRIDS